MLLRSAFLLFILIIVVNAIYYDYYSSKPLSKTLLNYYNSKGKLATCAIDIKPCNASEGRRVDGSCNSIDYPTRGTFYSPLTRILPAFYINGSYSRKSVSGKELPLPRKVRVDLLSQGKSYNLDLTLLVPSFSIFMFSDIGSLHDIKFFLINKTDCCGKWKHDYMCTPNIIPKDDPVHRFSGIRCMNLTRPLTYQYLGCTNASIPSPIQEATAVYDLSQIYNANNKKGATARAFVGGLLLVEEENGIVWPPNGTGFCPANSPGKKCFENYSNALLPIQLFSIWFVRNHNMYAKQLAKINPCWNDEMLYQIARDINIAFIQQIHIYEFLMILMGRKLLTKTGVISKIKSSPDCTGFRDIYDSKLYPTITLEYAYILRWFHLLQHGTVKMYKPDGTFIKDYPLVNSTLRTEYLARGYNIFYLTQGHFRQPASKARHSIDYDMAERGLPYVQQATDVPTSDLHKGRLFGTRPYIDYLNFCFGHKITSFDQLTVIMKKDSILQLKGLYEDVRDIDLMAGLWCENYLDEGKAPPTLSCIMGDNVHRAIKGDRHWYERPNRPYAFTADQLKEIRKVTLALLLCSVGDGVTEIQRHAFLNISPKNPLVSCDDIPKINICKWRDPKCKSSECN